MNTPDTRDIAEVKTSRTGLGRKTARQPRTNGKGSATPGSPRMLLKSGAPGLAPVSVPDCDDDGPSGLAARGRGEVRITPASYAETPAIDPNSSLIDELERILRGDFAGEDDVPAGDRRPRYPSFGADPLSLLDFDADDVEEDDIVADFAAPFERAVARAEPHGERVIAPSTGRSPLRPAAGVRHTVVFDDDDRDSFGYFDEGPPRTADFWHPNDDAAPERNVRRPRRRLSRGYLTVSGLLLLVAAGGIYSTMQLRGDPGGTLPDPTGVTAANAVGGVAAEEPRLVNTTVEAPPPMAAAADTPEGAAFAAVPEGGAGPVVDPVVDPVVAEVPAEPAVVAEQEPRIVPLFRTPDDGAVAGAPAEGPAANGPAEAVALAEPAGGAAPTPPAAIAETPAPAAAVGGTRQAIITDWVNLRADNSMNARVVLVIPMGATVELIGCPGWCEVIYEGTRGFVGPDFVDPL